MTDDATLIREYIEQDSEESFAELVRRHLPLVHGAALRQLRGDPHLAQEVCQIVFTTLARKARSLRRHPVLAGWLYVTTRYAVAEITRAERRRRFHEYRASTLPSDGGVSIDWEHLRPVIDVVLLELSAGDRDAVILRFFECRTFGEVGRSLGVSEDAARMRVERALTRLQRALECRGITSTASALGLALAAQSASAARLPSAELISGGALASTHAVIGGSGLWQLYTMGKIANATLAAVVAVGASVVLLQQQSRARLNDRLESLRQDYREVLRLREANARLAAQLHDSTATPKAAALPQSPNGDTRLVPLSSAGPGRVLALPGELRSLGSATPELAYESTLWAKQHRDAATLSRLIELDPTAKLRAEALFARLPPAQQLEVGSAEALIAQALTWNAATRDEKGFPLTDDEAALGIPGSIRFRIIDEADGVVSIQMLDSIGNPRGIVRHYHRTESGWREQLPAGQARTILKSY